ncbi:hypothetical protein AB4876_12725 [Zhongshania guokunii]|uniref:Uncharacterized protein n=1 Tax=Zhongshania guokunii TaxID=641783 RepID=A0ABV3U8K6_9GAMM
MNKRILPALTLGASMFLSAANTHAQVPVVGMLPTGAGFNFPELGALGLDGSLPGIDALSVDTLNMGGQDLGPLTGAAFALNSLLPTLSKPGELAPATLGGPDILFGFVPSAEVLYKNPVAIISYVLNGGTILSPSLNQVPPIPVLSQPLATDELAAIDAIGLPLDGALPTDILPLNLLSPNNTIDQALGLGAQLISAAPSF